MKLDRTEIGVAIAWVVFVLGIVAVALVGCQALQEFVGAGQPALEAAGDVVAENVPTNPLDWGAWLYTVGAAGVAAIGAALTYWQRRRKARRAAEATDV